MSNIVYQEKFISWPVISFVLLVDVLMYFTLKLSLGYIIFIFFSSFALLNFYSLTIELEGNIFHYSYGLGLISTSLSGNAIDSFDIKDMNSLIPWIYNPSGTESLVIKLRDLSTIRLPAREPKKIINILKSNF